MVDTRADTKDMKKVGDSHQKEAGSGGIQKRKKRLRKKRILRRLEPRVMLDAAAVATAAEVAENTPEPEPASETTAKANTNKDGGLFDDPEAAPDFSHEQASEIIFIDSRVENPGQLTAAIENEAITYTLDPTKDGVQQIADILANHRDISAIHLVSHGDDGHLLLGESVLSSHSLTDYGSSLSAWGESLSENGDIVIWGCNVAETETGQAFVDRLSEITGADIAASTDITGGDAHGGDFELEYQRGSIEEDGLDDAQGAASYDGALASPTALTLDTNSITENAATGTAVGTITGSDPDAGDTLTYALTDDAGGRFAIDPDSGAITVADGTLLNHENAAAHTVAVRVTDSGGATYDQNFTINISDVNEAPTALTLDNNSVAENASRLTVIGTVTGSDPDSGDTLTYSLTDNAGGRFFIDSDSGQIKVARTNFLDYETAASHTITVRVTDSDGATHEQDFTINVTDIDDAPTSLAIVPAGANNLVVNGGFENPDMSDDPATRNSRLFIDPDTIPGWSGNGEKVTLIESNVSQTTDEGDQWLRIDYYDDVIEGIYQDIQTVAGQTYVLSFDSATQRHTAQIENEIEVYWQGNLLGTVKPFSWGWNTYSFVVTGSGGEDRLEFRETSSPNLHGYGRGNQIDHVRLFEADAVAVAENASTGTLIGTAIGSDVDGGHTLTYALTDDAGGRFAIDADSGAITVADGTLLNHENAAAHTVAVRVTDSGGATYDQNFTINVSNVNEAPTALALDTNSITENAATGTAVGTITGSDPDSGETLTYALTDDAGGRFAIDADSGAITVADGTLLNHENAAAHTVAVRVTDSGGATYDQNFTINVSNVNEAPTALALDTNSITENAATGTAVGTITGSDPDSGETLTYALTDDAGGRFAIDADSGAITVADGTLLNHENAAAHTVAVRVTDSGGATYDQNFTINVSNVNEAPTALALDTNSITENAATGTAVGTITGSDPDSGETLTYALTDDAGGRFTIDPDSGAITVADGTLPPPARLTIMKMPPLTPSRCGSPIAVGRLMIRTSPSMSVMSMKPRRLSLWTPTASPRMPPPARQSAPSPAATPIAVRL